MFGGFTNEKWNANNNYVYDKNAFIFSLINPENKPAMLPTKHPEESIYCHPHYGPTFGKGHDIYISDHSNINKLSHSLICNTYQHPEYAHNSLEARRFLAGSEKFCVAEIEVFHKVH